MSLLSFKFLLILVPFIGKTLAFLLPAVERLLKLPKVPQGISILVLSPTRELVLQVYITINHSVQFSSYFILLDRKRSQSSFS